MGNGCGKGLGLKEWLERVECMSGTGFAVEPGARTVAVYRVGVEQD